MSEIVFSVDLKEVIVDENGDFVKAYSCDLPHSKFAAEQFCKAWNKDTELMTELVNEVADNRIAIIFAKRQKLSNGITSVGVHFVAKPYARLSEHISFAIMNWFDAQMVDGFGEGFFGNINIMTAPDGTRFYLR